MKTIRKFTLEQFEDQSWAIKEEEDDNIMPHTLKNNSRDMVARLSQLLHIGPVSPQTEPERIELIL